MRSARSWVFSIQLAQC